MEILTRYSTIIPMLDVCKKIKNGECSRKEILDVLEFDDYKYEIDRYDGRISKDEFVDYLININHTNEMNIENKFLRTHHEYYKHLFDNIDFYYEKAKEFPKMLDK